MAPVDQDVVHSKANWYQMESRLREVIHRVILPIITRMQEDRDYFMKTEADCKTNAQKIKELEEYVFYWKREEVTARAAELREKRLVEEVLAKQNAQTENKELPSESKVVKFDHESQSESELSSSPMHTPKKKKVEEQKVPQISNEEVEALVRKEQEYQIPKRSQMTSIPRKPRQFFNKIDLLDESIDNIKAEIRSN